MSLMDTNFDDVKDLRSVEPGEYKIEIQEAVQGVGQTSGKPYVKIRFSIPDVPEAKDINHFLSLPMEGEEEKTQNSKLRRLKAFFIAFKVDTQGLSLNDALSESALERLVGREAWAILEEEEDEQYGTQNRVKRFM